MKFYIYFLFTIAFIVKESNAQQRHILIEESFNSVSQETNINNYNFSYSYNYSGNVTIRTTRPSSNYINSSGGGNLAYINNHQSFKILNIPIVNYQAVDINFGMMKFGNILDGSDFEIVINLYGDESEEIIFKPNLPSGDQTSNWYFIEIPINIMNKTSMDIEFRNKEFLNNYHEYRIDDITITGQEITPLNINDLQCTFIDNIFSYQISDINDLKKIEIQTSDNGVLFTPYIVKENISIKSTNVIYKEYAKIVLHYENKYSHSKIYKNIQTKNNSYSWFGNTLKFRELQEYLIIYSINGNVLGTYYDVNEINFSSFPPNLYIIRTNKNIIKWLKK